MLNKFEITNIETIIDYEIEMGYREKDDNMNTNARLKDFIGTSDKSFATGSDYSQVITFLITEELNDHGIGAIVFALRSEEGADVIYDPVSYDVKSDTMKCVCQNPDYADLAITFWVSSATRRENVLVIDVTGDSRFEGRYYDAAVFY